VLAASLFVQLFALVTPLFFQIVIDKVLVHKGASTLVVVVIGLAVIGLFDVTLQYLRTYALSHTTSRIDVELGARLFDHLLRLPLAYFETRPAGQTVARMREPETVRAFLTGQGCLRGARRLLMSASRRRRSLNAFPNASNAFLTFVLSKLNSSPQPSHMNFL
jgi:subfamily B ATP-binding cassette protein HlyB/CyaB